MSKENESNADVAEKTTDQVQNEPTMLNLNQEGDTETPQDSNNQRPGSQGSNADDIDKNVNTAVSGEEQKNEGEQAEDGSPIVNEQINNFPQINAEGEKYCDEITNNIIIKLKTALGIDENEASHWQLQRFFCEKFKRPVTPEYTENVPDKPSLEMLSREIFGYMQDPETLKEKASNEAKFIKEQMIGYTNAIIQRQDRYDMCKGIESLDVEAASRRVLKELVSHYNKLDQEQTQRVNELDEFGKETREKCTSHNIKIKKLENAVLEIADLRKKVSTSKSYAEEVEMKIDMQVDRLRESIDNSQQVLKNRIDQIGTIDDRVKMVENQCQAIQTITLNTKKEIFDAWTKQKMETLQVQNNLMGYESRLDKTMEDAKYWLTTYTNSFKEHDKDMKGLRQELCGRLDSVLDDLRLRVSVTDMKLNFKKLNDMLWIKFKQLEDTKAGLRDVIAFQRDFYPLQMQVSICENLRMCQAVQEDQSYQRFTQQKLEELTNTIEKAKEVGKRTPDVEYASHYEELDRHQLRSSEWKTTPLENPEHDFVTPLVKKYLEDLEQRQEKATAEESNYCAIMRKPVHLNGIEKHMDGLRSKADSLRNEAKARELDLDTQRLLKAQSQRISRIINSKMDFQRSKVFKRQNSNEPKLEDHGDLDDHEGIEEGLDQLKMTVQAGRKFLNKPISDVTYPRRFIDPLATETNSQMNETMRKTKSTTKLQQKTGETKAPDEPEANPGQMILKPCRMDKHGVVKVLKRDADMRPGDALLMMLAMDPNMNVTGMSLSQMAATFQSAMSGPIDEDPSKRRPLHEIMGDGQQIQIQMTNVQQEQQLQQQTVEEPAQEPVVEAIEKPVEQPVKESILEPEIQKEPEVVEEKVKEEVQKPRTPTPPKPPTPPPKVEVKLPEPISEPPKIVQQLPPTQPASFQEVAPKPKAANPLAQMAGMDPTSLFGGGPGNNKKGGPSGPMDAAAKRDLIKEIKNELKPLINQLSELQVSRATEIIKNQLRKHDADIIETNKKLTAKINRDVKTAKKEAKELVDEVTKRLEQEMGFLKKQRVRDKSDMDNATQKVRDLTHDLSGKLNKHEEYFIALAGINSTLIENVNMQMEAETADLLDRRMMQLLGAAHKKLDTPHIKKTSEELAAKALKTKDWDALESKLNSNIAIPELGLHGDEDRSSTLPSIYRKGSQFSRIETQNGSANKTVKEANEDDSEAGQIDKETIEVAARSAYQKHTSLNQQELRKEFQVANDLLKQSGQLPFTIDNNCLNCMSSGRDTSTTMRLFKLACLSYQPSNVAYREHTISRATLIGMRRDLIDRISGVVAECDLFSKESLFPRRYFDDLVLQQQMAATQEQNEIKIANKQSGTIDQYRLKQLLMNPKPLPFGQISGKNTGTSSPLTRNFSMSHNQFQEEANSSIAVGPNGEYMYGQFNREGQPIRQVQPPPFRGQSLSATKEPTTASNLKDATTAYESVRNMRRYESNRHYPDASLDTTHDGESRSHARGLSQMNLRAQLQAQSMITTRNARNRHQTIETSKSAISALGDFSDRGISMTPKKINLKNRVQQQSNQVSLDHMGNMGPIAPLAMPIRTPKVMKGNFGIQTPIKLLHNDSKPTTSSKQGVNTRQAAAYVRNASADPMTAAQQRLLSASVLHQSSTNTVAIDVPRLNMPTQPSRINLNDKSQSQLGIEGATVEINTARLGNN